jgi:hypothetical protein
MSSWPRVLDAYPKLNKNSLSSPVGPPLFHAITLVPSLFGGPLFTFVSWIIGHHRFSDFGVSPLFLDYLAY